MIVPSNSIAFSEFMMQSAEPASKISEPAATIDFDLPAITGERALAATMGADALREDALR